MSNLTEIYTDGSCLGNPGRGGWSVVSYWENGSVLELGGTDEKTTNNRMEMVGAIAALRLLDSLKISQTVPLYTDSEYLVKGITQWIRGWKKKGWQTTTGKPVINQDLWEVLDQCNSPKVKWQHIRGHSGNPGNERCDEIARAFAAREAIALRQNLPNPQLKTILQEIQSHPVTGVSDSLSSQELKYKQQQTSLFVNEEESMSETTPNNDDLQLPRSERIANLQNMIETLRIADEVGQKGYLISSSELADLMNVNASAVTSRGDRWAWRNWAISRVRREGNQILWQMERVDMEGIGEDN